jgi:hypothetical protein
MGWETLMPNVMLEFFNTFLIKGTNIYFRHKDRVYVISKQLIIDVFRVCVEGYVQELKRLVNNSLIVHALKVVDLHLQILLQINGMQKNLGLPYSIRYHATIFVIY